MTVNVQLINGIAGFYRDVSVWTLRNWQIAKKDSTTSHSSDPKCETVKIWRWNVSRVVVQ